MLKHSESKRKSNLWLKIPPDTFYLGLIRKVISDIAVKVGFPREEVSKMEMAVDEACSAVIKHSISNITKIKKVNVEKNISLQITVSKTKITVTIEFSGPPINLQQRTKVNPEELLNKLDLSSLAIYIIKTFMDKVHYTQSNGTNRLKMTKLLKKTSN